MLLLYTFFSLTKEIEDHRKSIFLAREGVRVVRSADQNWTLLTSANIRFECPNFPPRLDRALLRRQLRRAIRSRNSDVLIVTHVRRRKDASSALPNAPAVDFPQNV